MIDVEQKLAKSPPFPSIIHRHKIWTQPPNGTKINSLFPFLYTLQLKWWMYIFFVAHTVSSFQQYEGRTGLPHGRVGID